MDSTYFYIFPAQRAADGEVQLPDCDSDKTGEGRNRRCGLGQADRTGAAQNETRPLSTVHSRGTATAPGGDGTKTRQVEALRHTYCPTKRQHCHFTHFKLGVRAWIWFGVMFYILSMIHIL